MEREIFEQLKKYEGHLYNATYGSFIRLADNNEKADLERLHKEHFGNDGNIMGGCNRCVLNALRKLGRDYFNEKKIIQEEEKQKEQTNNQVEEKPKRTRKKKEE